MLNWALAKLFLHSFTEPEMSPSAYVQVESARDLVDSESLKFLSLVDDTTRLQKNTQKVQVLYLV